MQNGDTMYLVPFDSYARVRAKLLSTVLTDGGTHDFVDIDAAHIENGDITYIDGVAYISVDADALLFYNESEVVTR